VHTFLSRHRLLFATEFLRDAPRFGAIGRFRCLESPSVECDNEIRQIVVRRIVYDGFHRALPSPLNADLKPPFRFRVSKNCSNEKAPPKRGRAREVLHFGLRPLSLNCVTGMSQKTKPYSSILL
jgi:hypothetical protein